MKLRLLLKKSSCFSPSLDDEERLREELKDLIDDNPIEEDDASENDSDTGSGGDEEGGSGKKRKKHEDDDLDDRLEDDDYDLIEENLGVKVERRVSKKGKQSEKEKENMRDIYPNILRSNIYLYTIYNLYNSLIETLQAPATHS